MSIFKHRPLALGCAVFLVLLYALYFLSAMWSIIIFTLGIALLISAVILTVKGRKEGIKRLCTFFIPLAIALILCSTLAMFTFKLDYARSQRYVNTEGSYKMLVEDERYESDFYCLYVCKVEELDQRMIVISYDAELDIGQRVAANLSIVELNDSDTGYSERDAMRTEGIYLKAVCRDAYVISEENYDIRMRFRLINNRYSERIASLTNEDTSGILSALFLGNKKGLKPSDSRDFARLGISHILALSGMHLSIIAAITGGLLDVLGAGKKNKYILTLTVIILFVALTGFSESVMRAAVMLIILYTLFFFKLRADFVTEIFLSVSLICTVSPYSVMSVSLLLSFLAMLGCVISSFALSKRRINKVARVFLSGIVTTVSVTLVTLPIVFISFGTVSVVAPIANLVFIPLFDMLLYIAPLVLLLGGVPVLGNGIIWVSEGITGFILYISGGVAALDGIAFPIYTPAHAIGVALISAGVILILVLSKRRLKISLAVLSLGILVIAGQTSIIGLDRWENTYVSTYSDARGDRTYVESNGKICVIDASSVSKASVREVYYKVTDMGYLDIGTYVLTDYSAWTYSALDMLTDAIYVRRVVLPPFMDESELALYVELVFMLNDKGVEVQCSNMDIEFEDATVRFAPSDKLPRSDKHLVAFTVEGETSRYTYVGASVFESRRANEFVLKYLPASDAVYFGGYGPELRYSFKYDLTGVDYCMFSTRVLYYANIETEGVRTVLEGTRFVLR